MNVQIPASDNFFMGQWEATRLYAVCSLISPRYSVKYYVQVLTALYVKNQDLGKFIWVLGERCFLSVTFRYQKIGK